jgi:hypothetical protein
MRRVLRCAGLALLLALVPALVAQEKKPDADKADKPDKAMPDKNAPKDKKEAIDKLQTGGKITGKLTQWGASDKTFTVKVTVPYAELNEGEYKALLQEQAYASDPRRSPQDRLAHARAAADHQVKLYTAKKTDVDFYFIAGTDMKVRTANPLVFDDKGKPKKLTAKEKDELKGPDKSLPGYTADISDVHQDSIVTVYLPKKKSTKTAPKDKADKGLADNKLDAVMLVIELEPPPAK